MRLRHSNDTNFSFDVTLHRSGVIEFNYHLIRSQEGISKFKGEMTIGLSDAFEEESDQIPSPFDFPVRGSHFTQYHKIDLGEQRHLVTNGTRIIFVPKANCNQMTDCQSCVDFSDR